MAVPNEKQQALGNSPIEPVLALAPDGCGKTEALGMRAIARPNSYG